MQNPIFGRYGLWDAEFAVLAQNISDILNQNNSISPLCEIMKRHGSDKGDSHHNYTKVYTVLFEKRRNNIENLLEVGIGTNNEDVPSSMGADGIPGASLRGWKEYFPNAHIYGADIDNRILFSEERIKTHFVDQTSIQTVLELRAQLQPNLFDVIVDDGLHAFEANANLFIGTFDLLKKKGFYIIEDIIKDGINLARFDAFLRGVRKSAMLIQLPHETNIIDNIIAVIQA